MVGLHNPSDALGTYGSGWRSVRDAPVDDRHHRDDVLDLIVRHRQVVAVQDDQVRQLAELDRSRFFS